MCGNEVKLIKCCVKLYGMNLLVHSLTLPQTHYILKQGSFGY